MTYSIERLEPVNAHELVTLFEEVWPEAEGHSETTEWAFRGSPVGTSLIFVARSNENPSLLIGARGSIGWPLQTCSGQQLKAYQFHGTCVHPRFRRQGIFSELNQAFLHEFMKEQGDAIFNVSVSASRRGYEKLGWSYLSGLRRYLWIANPVKFGLKYLIHRSELRGELNAISGSNEELTDWGALEKLNRIRQARLERFHHTAYDEATLKWRYSKRAAGYRYWCEPGKAWCSYKLRSSNAFKEVLVGDVWLSDVSVKHIRQLRKQLCVIERPDIISIVMSISHPLREPFQRSGFLPDPKGDLHFGVRTVTDSASSLLEPNKWALTTADIDTF